MSHSLSSAEIPASRPNSVSKEAPMAKVRPAPSGGLSSAPMKMEHLLQSKLG